MPLLLALLLLIGLPAAEIYVIVRVGEAIGLLPVLLALLATSLLGARLVRAQGRAVLRRFAAALGAGDPPAREALDGALVFAGGALLIVPGFITDAAGALLLAPPTRSLARRLIVRHYRARVLAWVARSPAAGRGPDVEGTAVELGPRELPR
jgi:UPF0716 protein FxsA